MSTPLFARILSVSLVLVPVALVASGCAGDAAKTDAKDAKDGKDAKDAKDGNAANDPKPGDGAIAGKPVEGDGGKVGVAAGDSGADGKEYTLEIEPGEATVGAESKVSIKIVPQGEWHMNLEYPTKLEVVAPEGTTVTQAKLAKADAVKLDAEGCEFAVAFTPADVGTKKFTGEFKFAICQDEACVPKTETLAFEVAVK